MGIYKVEYLKMLGALHNYMLHMLLYKTYVHSEYYKNTLGQYKVAH
jgi:hypothetical protein